MKTFNGHIVTVSWLVQEPGIIGALYNTKEFMTIRINLIFVMICCVFIRTGFAQKTNSNETVLSVKTGMSFLITEIYGDFSGAVNEFNSQPGIYTGIELSHFFTDALEAGGGLSSSILRGKASSPDFSAIGYQYYLEEPFNEAVQYKNMLLGPQLFARYHFGRNGQDSPNLTWFVKAGAGVLFHKSELYFSNRTENELVFGKGRGDSKQGKLASGVFVVGGGFGHKITDVISIKLAADFNMVGYDFLDVVHNFDDAGNRRNIIGVFTNISAGLAIKLNKPEVLNDEHLPFKP